MLDITKQELFALKSPALYELCVQEHIDVYEWFGKVYDIKPKTKKDILRAALEDRCKDHVVLVPVGEQVQDAPAKRRTDKAELARWTGEQLIQMVSRKYEYAESDESYGLNLLSLAGAIKNGLDGLGVKVTTLASYRIGFSRAVKEYIDVNAVNNLDAVKRAADIVLDRHLLAMISTDLLEYVKAEPSIKETRGGATTCIKVAGVYEWARLQLDSVYRGDVHKLNWYDVMLSLLMLTGRRSSEIAFSAKFARIPGNDKELIFSGQLKSTKGQAKDRFDKPYTIPVLGNPDHIIKALEYLDEQTLDPNKTKGVIVPVRVKPDGYSNNIELAQQAHKVVSVPLSRASVRRSEMIEVTGERPDKFSINPHGWRQVYAQVCKTKFMPDNSQENVYISDILGHGSDLNTSIRYAIDYKVMDASEV